MPISCVIMHKYNIIYTSPNGDSYLWNGVGFEKLDDGENGVLLYSGKSIKAEGIEKALATSRAAVAKEFPNDDKPDIKKVEVAVS